VGYVLEANGFLIFQGTWMYLHEEGGIPITIMKVFHRDLNCVHPSVKKIYADMKNIFFWVGMKHVVVYFVSSVFNFNM